MGLESNFTDQLALSPSTSWHSLTLYTDLYMQYTINDLLEYMKHKILATYNFALPHLSTDYKTN